MSNPGIDTAGQSAGSDRNTSADTCLTGILGRDIHQVVDAEKSSLGNPTTLIQNFGRGVNSMDFTDAILRRKQNPLEWPAYLLRVIANTIDWRVMAL